MMFRRPSGHPARFPVTVAGACLALAACAGPEPAVAPAEPPPAGAQAGTGEVDATGALAPPEQAQNAFTYDPAQAPTGAELEVRAGPAGAGTRVEIEVDGLLPDRGYAVHAHTSACGPTGDAAGPHFQNELDPAATPEQASVDPAYANPTNEIWLDLHTDGEGDGQASADVPFTFTERAPTSVIVHEAEHTATDAGVAGTAGGRLACLNVPFDGAAATP